VQRFKDFLYVSQLEDHPNRFPRSLTDQLRELEQPVRRRKVEFRNRLGKTKNEERTSGE
jgi:DNA-binding HxlR family transcriptional regulator